MELTDIKCKSCGAALNISEYGSYTCPYCGTVYEYSYESEKNTLPDYEISHGCIIKYNGVSKTPLIPSGINVIGKYAFSKSEISSIVIPEGIESIEMYAFSECGNLTSITIPKSVKKIGTRAFCRCPNLEFVKNSSDCELLRDDFVGTKYLSEMMKYESNIRLQIAEQRAENVKKKGCYIATAVYGSYNCPQVWTLRRFRDGFLSEHILGRAFISVYYAVSPTLVRIFGDTSWFTKGFRAVLDPFVNTLKSKGYSDTPYTDK